MANTTDIVIYLCPAKALKYVKDQHFHISCAYYYFNPYTVEFPNGIPLLELSIFKLGEIGVRTRSGDEQVVLRQRLHPLGYAVSFSVYLIVCK